MAVIGAAVFFGKRVSLSLRYSMVVQENPKAMFLFGAGSPTTATSATPSSVGVLLAQTVGVGATPPTCF